MRWGTRTPGSLLGSWSQHDPYTQQVPVPLQGNTYLQELDAVAGSPNGENDIKGTLRGPSPPASAQERDRGDLFPGGKSRVLCSGCVSTFPSNSKGFFLAHKVRNHHSNPGPLAPPPSLLVLNSYRDTT